MDGVIGPLSDGKLLLQLAVLFGVIFAAIALTATKLLGITVSQVVENVLLIGGFLFGVGTLFFGHMIWHYRRSRSSN